MNPVVGFALLTLGLAAGTLLIARIPLLRPQRPRAPRSMLVAIPARNEADVLAGLLRDLADQTLAPTRIVVVDDASTDATAAVARSFTFVELRAAAPTPAGWNPKSWALECATRGAREDVMVFLDADVRLGAAALAAIASELDRRGGIVTVAPRHDLASRVEALSLPFNAVAAMGAAGGRGVFGPCLALAQETYLALGGHRAISRELVDDLALARLARRSGVPVTVYRGGSQVRYRMYRTGARGIVAGWTKNIARGAGKVGVLRACAIGLWVTASCLPVATLAQRGPVAIAAAQWAAVGGTTYALSRRIGRFPAWIALTAPLLAWIFVAVFLRAAWHGVVRRPVHWKERRLPPVDTRRAGG